MADPTLVADPGLIREPQLDPLVGILCAELSRSGGPKMAGKRDKPEDIVLKLRQVEVLHGQGMAISDAVRQIGVTEPTYYRWRKQYGGMNRDQLKRLKELETENQRLRRAVSDLTLDKLILTEAARGNF
jgi:putative transposase